MCDINTVYASGRKYKIDLPASVSLSTNKDL